MAARDRHLLFGRVAVESDHFHAVEQRRRNRVGDVGRRDEQHLREIELDVEIVIAERVVLRRVEHLEQRRRRIAAPVGADLVDFVEHDHRIHRAGVAQRAHEPSRQRADVGAAMAADFRFVADAAERHPDELPAGGSRDRLADRGLARSRRSDQRQDDARAAVLGHAALGAQLADRQVLGDAPLHVVETFVVGVEHLARVDRVETLLGSLRPGHRQQPVEIRADHRRLGVRVAHPLETVQLAFGLLPHRIGHAGARRSSDGIRRRPSRRSRRAPCGSRPSGGAGSTRAAASARRLRRRRGCACAPAALPSRSRWNCSASVEPLDDVEGFEQLQLLGEVQVGR